MIRFSVGTYVIGRGANVVEVTAGQGSSTQSIIDLARNYEASLSEVPLWAVSVHSIERIKQ